MTKLEVIAILKSEISRESGLSIKEIGDAAGFFSLGLDSISCVYVLDRVEKKIKIELNPIWFWDYPTIELLANHIASLNINEQ
jgi:acyl carrier protein